ncbi:uncharacterized protein PFLUO_LOCUS2047 [Penicillium psychrofluorescens]|uniref:uncharacterized protein n=1 Tax=Penicillium psychrofluorescens TaxID=3158075 RepID=UPI003CCDC47F
MAVLDDQFLKELASLAAPYPRYKWYLSAMVALGAMNYPEEIPNLYTRLLASYIPKEEQFSETRKIREAFTKLCGIQGAAKTGSALRNLYNATPKDLLDPTRYRKNDTDEIAFARGEEFHKRIYGPNPSYEDNANNLAAPDYHYIVRNYFYGRIFSYDGIIDDMETSQVIISCLIGIDCMQQLRNHMKGMQYNGARKEEVEMIREIVVKVARKLDVSFKSGNPIAVPDIE